MKNKSGEKQQLLKDFGMMLRDKRIQKNLTQAELSDIAGITNVYLRELEHGNYSATWLIWLKLCAALDIDVHEVQKRLKALQNS